MSESVIRMPLSFDARNPFYRVIPLQDQNANKFFDMLSAFKHLINELYIIKDWPSLCESVQAFNHAYANLWWSSAYLIEAWATLLPLDIPMALFNNLVDACNGFVEALTQLAAVVTTYAAELGFEVNQWIDSAKENNHTATDFHNAL